MILYVWRCAYGYSRMDTLSCLQKQNKGTDTGGYSAEKLSPILPEM